MTQRTDGPGRRDDRTIGPDGGGSARTLGRTPGRRRALVLAHLRDRRRRGRHGADRPVAVALRIGLLYLAYCGDECAVPVAGEWARRLA